MEELVKEAKKGNNDAFSNLIKMYKKELYLIARSKLNNDDDIADCIQETILKSYKNIKKLKNNSSFKYWIIKILINECNNFYKKKERNELPIDNENIKEMFDLKNQIHNSIDFGSIIKDLSIDEKQILTLYYVSGYNTKEIGKLLKKNDNTIRIKMMRAKNKLKEMYKGGNLYE